MSDFYTQRGLTPPLHDFINQGQEAAAAPPALPDDYAARARAMELAVQITQSRFDGGQERVLSRARAFYAFLTGKRPYELSLTKEAYEAAENAIREMAPADCGYLAETALDAAWEVIIEQGSV